MWVRIDNRLIHGQIIETWLPYTGAHQLVVVNDDLASDKIRQDILSLAIPQHIEVCFVSIEALRGLLEKMSEPECVLVLFSTCGDARKAFERGVGFTDLNIGNLHYSPGKKQVCDHVALSADDQTCLDFFSKKGVKIDFRCVPNDAIQMRMPW